MESSNKKFFIAGLGKTGLSCAHFLAKKQQSFIMADSRENPPAAIQFKQDFPNQPLHVNGFPSDLVLTADEIILSPGIPTNTYPWTDATQQGISIIGDIELFARYAKSPIVGITGSNGKSTVTTLVGEMIKHAGYSVGVGGNLGTPALDLLTDPEPQAYVLELSSFQLELTSSLPLRAAVILNISPDHLDRYASVSEYSAAKQRIYSNADAIIYNRQDPATYPAGTFKNKSLISFGLDEPQAEQFGLKRRNGKAYLACGEDLLIDVNDLRLKGQHNWQNALAALALGVQLNLPMASMLQTLREFPGLPHRCQWVAEIHGVNWYNDSKGTNVGASMAAIEGLGEAIPGQVILIAGGQGKEADFSVLQNVVANYVKAVILLGEDAQKIATGLGNKVPIYFVKNMQEAVQTAHEIAAIHDCVLLSPACASFDMFQNFEHRGEIFSELVRELASCK